MIELLQALDWVQLVQVVVAAGIGGGAVKIIDAARQWRLESRRLALEEREAAQAHSVPAVVASIQRIHDEMEALLMEMPMAGRAVLLVAWPDDRKYSSVLYERYPVGVQAIRRTWERVRIDATYRAMLDVVAERGYIRNTTETMPHGQLRDLYITEGIVGSDVSLVTDDLPQCLVYLSLTWAVDPPEGPVRGRIAMACRAMRSELEHGTDLHLARIYDDPHTGEVPS